MGDERCEICERVMPRSDLECASRDGLTFICMDSEGCEIAERAAGGGDNNE